MINQRCFNVDPVSHILLFGGNTSPVRLVWRLVQEGGGGVIIELTGSRIAQPE